jgi:hypothetical protein
MVINGLHVTHDLLRDLAKIKSARDKDYDQYNL